MDEFLVPAMIAAFFFLATCSFGVFVVVLMAYMHRERGWPQDVLPPLGSTRPKPPKAAKPNGPRVVVNDDQSLWEREQEETARPIV